MCESAFCQVFVLLGLSRVRPREKEQKEGLQHNTIGFGSYVDVCVLGRREAGIPLGLALKSPEEHNTFRLSWILRSPSLLFVKV